jgi:hypothetical protein
VSDVIDKKYFFLAGLFRSGNTVLSSILNQNPTLYVSPLSPVVEYMWRCHQDGGFESAITYPNKNNMLNMISKMPDAYYQDINKPVIIDRNKTWANPANISMIKTYITPTPKIIFTIRPLRECIASAINIMRNRLFLEMNYNKYPYNINISENDNMAEYLLVSNYYELLYFAHSSFIDKSNKDLIHLVKYDELLDNPGKTMDEVYSFLELDNFNHDFSNIIKIEEELEVAANLPFDLHKIRPKLEKSKLNISKVLSKEIIEKCDEMDLFYN